jgi:hypothetical protein
MKKYILILGLGLLSCKKDERQATIANVERIRNN